MKDFIQSLDKAILACDNMGKTCDKISLILEQTTKILNEKP